MNLTQRILLSSVVQALLDEGYRITISDQDGGGLYVYAVPDNGDAPSDGFAYWVRLEPANDGVDFIADYTTNLTALVEPINALASTLTFGA